MCRQTMPPKWCRLIRSLVNSACTMRAFLTLVLAMSALLAQAAEREGADLALAEWLVRSGDPAAAGIEPPAFAAG